MTWSRASVDSFLVYASSSLAVMGSIALVLSIFFHMRLKRLTSLSKDSKANVFNKTFVVFEPYEKITLFHKLLTLLPFIPLIGGFGMAALLLIIIDSGLLLTVLVSIMGLSMIMVEESLEAYAQSKLLVKAIRSGSDFGTGDMRLLHLTKKLLPRLSVYYFGLSVFLLALAAVLPYVWSSALWYFAMFFGLMIQASLTAGPTSWMTAIFLYAVTITVFVVLVTLAKNRIFRFKTEPGPI